MSSISAPSSSRWRHDGGARTFPHSGLFVEFILVACSWVAASLFARFFGSLAFRLLTFVVRCVALIHSLTTVRQF